MGAVAQAMIQSVQDQIALDIADRASHQSAGHGGGRNHRALHAGILRYGHRGGADLGAIGKADGFRADLGPAGQQHGAMDGVFQLAGASGRKGTPLASAYLRAK